MKLVARFDTDGDERLNDAERARARQFVKEERGGRDRNRGPFGPRGRFDRDEPSEEPVVEAERLAPADVATYPDRALYDPGVLRTLFLTFSRDDWEAELEDFYRTDVEVPATLVVDGKTYEGVGVRFRGNSSFFTVRRGQKRSLNLSIDHAIDGQRLMGYKTLNLLNSHADPTFLREALYSHAIGDYVAAPRANLVKLVINGESWGVYVNLQQFNKDFLEENFGSRKGVRWKVPPGMRGGGGLTYEVRKGGGYAADPGGREGGDDDEPRDSGSGEVGEADPTAGDDRETAVDAEVLERYKQAYQLKSSRAGDAAWRRLVELTRVLEETPVEERVEALRPLLDIDGALWFLATDNVFVDGDGYFSRGSDYALFLDENGRFHLVPHDSNESFGTAGGGPNGLRRGRRGPPSEFGPGGFPPRGFPPPDGDRPGGRAGDPGDQRPERGDRPDRAGDAGRDERPERAARPDRDEADRPPRDFDPRQRGRGFGRGGPRTDPAHQDPLLYADEPQRALIHRLLEVPELRQRYLAHVRTLVREKLSWESIGPVATAFHALIRPEVEKDTRKLYSMDAFLRGLEEKVDMGRRPVPAIRDFVTRRREFLLSHPEVARPQPRIEETKVGLAIGGQDVKVSVRTGGEVDIQRVVLYWCTTGAGAYERLRMEPAAEGASYEVTIPAQQTGALIRFYVEAVAADDVGTAVYWPARAEAGPASRLVVDSTRGESPVRINEIGASNLSIAADPQGEFDDYVELYNASDETVDLSRFYLSDDERNPRLWRFPQGTTLGPRQKLVVWADADGVDAPGLHASFELNRNGDRVLLVGADSDGNPVLDRIVFDELPVDRPLGRVPDGGDDLQLLER